MLTTGLALAVLTSAGFLVLYFKLPGSIRGFMCRHVLLTDAIACGLTYTLFGGTLVGLFAAGFVGLIVSANLALVNNPDAYKVIEHLARKTSVAKNKFIKWAVGQVASKETKQQPELKAVS